MVSTVFVVLDAVHSISDTTSAYAFPSLRVLMRLFHTSSSICIDFYGAWSCLYSAWPNIWFSFSFLWSLTPHDSAKQILIQDTAQLRLRWEAQVSFPKPISLNGAKAILSGKTAPRLIEDLREYDPRYQAKKSGRNLLSQPAPIFRPGVPLPLRREQKDCIHSLVKKDEQTDDLPDLIDETKCYTIATWCRKCKWHFHIKVDYSGRKAGQGVCNISDRNNLLHHLQLVESKDKPSSGIHTFLAFEAHRFVCSSTSCPLVVNIEIFPPRLTPALLTPISDNTKLRLRGYRVINDDPERFASSEPVSVTQAYLFLLSYLKDGFTAYLTQDPKDFKRITKRNKKFCLAFGQECDQIFKYLGFLETEDNKSDVCRLNQSSICISILCTWFSTLLLAQWISALTSS